VYFVPSIRKLRHINGVTRGLKAQNHPKRKFVWPRQGVFLLACAKNGLWGLVRCRDGSSDPGSVFSACDIIPQCCTESPMLRTHELHGDELNSVRWRILGDVSAFWVAIWFESIVGFVTKTWANLVMTWSFVAVQIDVGACYFVLLILSTRSPFWGHWVCIRRYGV
jgi:hypothetical protein